MYAITKATARLHEARKMTMRLAAILACCVIMFGGTARYAQSGVADPAAVLPLGLKILNEKIPPGGMLQLKLTVTEPKPILKGNQRLSYSSTFLAKATGINLYSPAGDASGVAVLGSGSSQFFFSSPLTSFGTNLDYPVVTMAIPVLATATRGKKVPLVRDAINSTWLDPSSQPYPVELQSGTLTINGTLSVSNVVPGSGVVAAGKPITLSGTGFPADAVVRVDNAVVTSVQFVNSTQLRITLAAATDMESRRIRVKNPATNELVTYYSYQRTASVGASTHALVASSYPLFSRGKWTKAYFKPVASGTSFSGLALQNAGAAGVTVKLDLLSKTGALLATKSISLPARSRIVRDVKEFFATAVTGTEIRVTCPVAIQMLGLLGNDSSRVVLPVAPATAP
jgi:hypothetical protein